MTGDDLLKFYERLYGPFTHMAPGDKAIWLRYLIQGGAQFAPFTYDLRVGNGLDMGPNASTFQKNAAHALTTKRIDALCHVAGNVRIIEVKQRAGLSAIGQLIGYRELYCQTINPAANCDMWLVTDSLQPDMRALLILNNIYLSEVGL
jgi:hypothetical protein